MSKVKFLDLVEANFVVKNQQHLILPIQNSIICLCLDLCSSPICYAEVGIFIFLRKRNGLPVCGVKYSQCDTLFAGNTF